MVFIRDVHFPPSTPNNNLIACLSCVFTSAALQDKLVESATAVGRAQQQADAAAAREEERKIYSNQQLMLSGMNGQIGPSEMARQQAMSHANDPSKHLKIIERILVEYLYA